MIYKKNKKTTKQYDQRIRCKSYLPSGICGSLVYWPWDSGDPWGPCLTSSREISLADLLCPYHGGFAPAIWRMDESLLFLLCTWYCPRGWLPTIELSSTSEPKSGSSRLVKLPSDWLPSLSSWPWPWPSTCIVESEVVRFCSSLSSSFSSSTEKDKTNLKKLALNLLFEQFY